MTQKFVDKAKEAFAKGNGVKDLQQYCDHMKPDGRTAVRGVPGFTYCDICGRCGGSGGPDTGLRRWVSED